MGKKIEIILLDHVNGLGSTGTRTHVARGYARNFLFPFKKAQLATPENIAILDNKLSELKTQQEAICVQARTDAETISAQPLILSVRASDEGKLFGSVTVIDILQLIEKHCGLTLKKQHIKLPQGHRSLHIIGEYNIDVILHPQVQTKLQLLIQKATDSL